MESVTALLEPALWILMRIELRMKLDLLLHPPTAKATASSCAVRWESRFQLWTGCYCFGLVFYFPRVNSWTGKFVPQPAKETLTTTSAFFVCYNWKQDPFLRILLTVTSIAFSFFFFSFLLHLVVVISLFASVVFLTSKHCLIPHLIKRHTLYSMSLWWDYSWEP